MAVESSEDPFAGARSFEWDERKQRSNIEKHGVDFVSAAAVFADPLRYTFRSPRQLGEVRYVTVGTVQGALLAVIATRRGDNIRIISARAARRVERQRYG